LGLYPIRAPRAESRTESLAQHAGRVSCRQPTELDGVLKRLERDGLVERVMDDGDKRARVVRLTPHGLLFWTDLQKRIYQFYAQAASTFRFDERVALVHYLNSLQRELMKVRLEKPQGTAVKKKRR